jgi:molybdopterin biosynthesis enzyme
MGNLAAHINIVRAYGLPCIVTINRFPTDRDGELWAEPVFGKSNLIYTLVKADGMMIIPIDANGIAAGELVDVRLF